MNDFSDFSILSGKFEASNININTNNDINIVNAYLIIVLLNCIAYFILPNFIRLI